MDPSRALEGTDSKNLFLDRLPSLTRKAIMLCANLAFFKKSKWYLAGGTALALQVGHRQSVDLDFFTPQNTFSEISVERTLLKSKEWQTSYREKGTIYGTMAGAKISLIAYPFFVSAEKFLSFGTLKILKPSDIAVMKIIAISQRGRKRDFVDLYWYCSNRKESLTDIIERAVKQYPGQKHNLPHFLKSLTYFEDAEKDPMPRLFFTATWKDIKKFFQTEVKKTARELLKLK